MTYNPDPTSIRTSGCSPRGVARLHFIRSGAFRAFSLATAFCLAIVAPANAVWVGKNSSNVDVTIDLKTAGPSNFSVLSYGASTNTVSLGQGTFRGSFGDIAVNPSMNGATINGDVFLGNGINTTNFIGHGTINGTVHLNQTTQLNQPKADATTAAIDALTIKSTISTSSVTSTKTITGSSVVGATNVLKLSSLDLTAGETLTLKAGAANQKFLIEVTGTFSLAGGADILIDTGNGLTPLDVLYVIGAGSSDVNITGTSSNASIIDGIILDHYGNINITYGQVNGEVIGNCNLVFDHTNVATSVIPEVSALFPLLGFFSLVAGGRVVTRRSSRLASAN